MTTPVSDTSHPPSDSHSVSASQVSVTPSSSVSSQRSIPPPPPESPFPYSYPFPPYSYYYRTYQPYTPPFMYPPNPPSQPPVPSDNQLDVAVRRVLGISSAPTPSTVTPPTGITSQATTSGKCHHYVFYSHCHCYSGSHSF